MRLPPRTNTCKLHEPYTLHLICTVHVHVHVHWTYMYMYMFVLMYIYVHVHCTNSLYAMYIHNYWVCYILTTCSYSYMYMYTCNYLYVFPHSWITSMLSWSGNSTRGVRQLIMSNSVHSIDRLEWHDSVYEYSWLCVCMSYCIYYLPHWCVCVCVCISMVHSRYREHCLPHF